MKIKLSGEGLLMRFETSSVKKIFLVHFNQLQSDLDLTLSLNATDAYEVLSVQDRLICRLEKWLREVAVLGLLRHQELELFGEILLANRKVYQVRYQIQNGIAGLEIEKVRIDESLQKILALLKRAEHRKTKSNEKESHARL